MSNGRLRVALLWLTDLVCVYSGMVFVAWVYRLCGFGVYESVMRIYLNLWPVGLIFTMINFAFRLYQGNALYPAAPVSEVEELRRIFWSAVLTHVGLLAVLALARQTTEGYSRAVIVISGLLTALFAQACRNFARRLMKRLDIAQIAVYLAGGGAAAEGVASALSKDSYIGFKVVRTFDSDFRRIVPSARKDGVKVLLACQDERLFKVQLEDFTTWFSYVEYFPTTSAFPISGAHPVVLDAIGGLEMVNQRRMRVMRQCKSALDFSLTIVAMVFALPLFVVIPLLIKLTSRGPVFYRAKRLGKFGCPIRVWKFRSMYADADARLAELLESDPAIKAEYESNFKIVNDPRVTPLGRFLRKTSLDEVPQLLNVLSGEMALIGPRPIVEKEISYYGKDYAVFSSVKPGITGLWQASGRSDVGYARRVALDTHYVLNWSPWLDIWILFRTVGAVLFMRGAC